MTLSPQRLISQDTFSFALVLLCLATGDISYVSKQGGGTLAYASYETGWRPKVRKSLRTASPEIVALIEEMWLTDFRARPAMKDVAVRLEACVFVGCVEAPSHAGAENAVPDNSSTATESSEALRCTNVAFLRAEIKALQAEKDTELAKKDARHRADRLDIAELKAALAGTSSSMEDEDDVGILGGMFICTSTSNS